MLLPAGGGHHGGDRRALGLLEERNDRVLLGLATLARGRLSGDRSRSLLRRRLARASVLYRWLPGLLLVGARLRLGALPQAILFLGVVVQPLGLCRGPGGDRRCRALNRALGSAVDCRLRLLWVFGHFGLLSWLR